MENQEKLKCNNCKKEMKETDIRKKQNGELYKLCVSCNSKRYTKKTESNTNVVIPAELKQSQIMETKQPQPVETKQSQPVETKQPDKDNVTIFDDSDIDEDDVCPKCGKPCPECNKKPDKISMPKLNESYISNPNLKQKPKLNEQSLQQPKPLKPEPIVVFQRFSK